MYNDLYNYSKRPQQLFRNSVFLEYCKISKKHFCFLMLQKQNVEKMGSGFNYFDRAVTRLLFTSAIPLLLPGTFVCYVSILDRYVALYSTRWTKVPLSSPYWRLI